MAKKRRVKRARYSINWARISMCAGALALVVAMIIVIPRFVNRDSALPVDRKVETSATPEVESTDETPKPEPTGTPRPAATGDPKLDVEGVTMLPVIAKAKNTPGKLALTVDDCFQVDNVRIILDMADEYGFKITFFPIGNVAEKSPELWREIYDRGHQIENHSYSHTDMTKLSYEEARLEITKQNDVIKNALGLDYQMSIFRPMGGTGRNEAWLHKLLGELNYSAIASWGLSGTRYSKETLDMLDSGQILLFHTTNSDVKRLKNVIPGAIEKGYQFVTLNELYNREPNAVGPLDGAPAE